MKPFLENRRTAPEDKLRVQFMGVHKITMTDTHTQAQTQLEISRPPIYVFDIEDGEEL